MVMEPSDYYQEALVYGDNAPLWVLSPEFPPFDGFPDLMMQEHEVEERRQIAHRSSFQKYSGPARLHLPRCDTNSRNIHRRVIEMLKRIPMLRRGEDEGGGGGSRGFRHMMRERHRREKLRQNYNDLHAMVSSFRSKNDKNSIVQSASAYILELKGVKEALDQRNEELKTKILGSSTCTNQGAKIKIRAANPHSSVDSMIAALRCLKNVNVKVKAMLSDFSKSEMSATMSVDTKIGTADVERAVEGALLEVEKKLHPGTNKYSHDCLVQNVT